MFEQVTAYKDKYGKLHSTKIEAVNEEAVSLAYKYCKSGYSHGFYPKAENMPSLYKKLKELYKGTEHE